MTQQQDKPDGDGRNERLEAVQRRAKWQAHVIRNTMTPTALAALLDLDDRTGPIQFVTELLEAMDPRDPLERMMIESVVLCHLQQLKLHEQAARADKAAVTKLYIDAARQLMAEQRRSTLAVKKYRSGEGGKKTTVVHQVIHQQNVAQGGQEVAYVEGAAKGEGRATCHDTELIGKREHEHREGRLRHLEEPQESGCRSS